MIDVKRKMKIIYRTRMTRMRRIFTDFLFNPYGVNGHTCHLFYNSLCPTGNKFSPIVLQSSRLTVFPSYSLPVL
jgi:hypothetical protein